jgi:hypothetical protein
MPATTPDLSGRETSCFTLMVSGPCERFVKIFEHAVGEPPVLGQRLKHPGQAKVQVAADDYRPPSAGVRKVIFDDARHFPHFSRTERQFRCSGVEDPAHFRVIGGIRLATFKIRLILRESDSSSCRGGNELEFSIDGIRDGQSNPPFVVEPSHSPPTEKRVLIVPYSLNYSTFSWTESTIFR